MRFDGANGRSQGHVLAHPKEQERRFESQRGTNRYKGEVSRQTYSQLTSCYINSTIPGDLDRSAGWTGRASLGHGAGKTLSSSHYLHNVLNHYHCLFRFPSLSNSLSFSPSLSLYI